MQLHTRHTNFIHIFDTKVDFSRNVLLCRGSELSGTWRKGEGRGQEGQGPQCELWRQDSGQQGLGEQDSLGMVAPLSHSSPTGGRRVSTQTY